MTATVQTKTVTAAELTEGMFMERTPGMSFRGPRGGLRHTAAGRIQSAVKSVTPARSQLGAPGLAVRTLSGITVFMLPEQPVEVRA